MLGDEQKRLYARQVSVSELGLIGQAALCEARARFAASAAPAARAVAAEYLQRAGVELAADGGEDALAANSGAAAGTYEVPLETPAELVALAGDVRLEACAAWLAGCFAAVEAIKHIAGVGTPARLDPRLVLSTEVI